MIDFFYEESASFSSKDNFKVKLTIYNLLSKIFYCISVVWALFAIIYALDFNNFLISLIVCSLIFFIFFGSGLFFSKAKERLSIDYDYSILSGTVSFSKVVGNNKRKKIITIDISSIERIGKPDGFNYDKFSKMPEIIQKTLTANKVPAENKDFYYLFFTAEGNKHLYIIECTKTFISNLVRFTRSISLDGDVK